MISVVVIYMLKYSNYEITFAEIPDEISLCINITNCPHMCVDCHSPWLREDNGTPLTYAELIKLIKQNIGISCVCFMGGDKEPWEVARLAKLIREDFPKLKTAWYSGGTEVLNTDCFNYIKVGPYIEKFGPLNCKTTNQILYEVVTFKTDTDQWEQLMNITHKFWKNDDNNN